MTTTQTNQPATEVVERIEAYIGRYRRENTSTLLLNEAVKCIKSTLIDAKPGAVSPQQAVAASSEPVPDQEEDAYLINRLSSILADVAIALKGDELPLHRHSYHDLADGVYTLKLEVELHRMQEA